MGVEVDIFRERMTVMAGVGNHRAEVNQRHGQGSMTTDRFFELNTELLDLIPGPTPDPP